MSAKQMIDPALLAVAIMGGILRISPALLWAAVGDCLSQRGGHFNLGLEGIVACGAMIAVFGAQWGGNPWWGVVAAAAMGGTLALFYCLCCLLPRVNELAAGIALLIGGVALAQFAGDSLVKLPSSSLPVFSVTAGKASLEMSAMLPLGILLAFALAWLLRFTRAGLLLTAAGDRKADVNLRLQGIRPGLVRTLATTASGVCAGIGGSCLSLFYPGGWSDQLATGVGITALTLAFLARTRPLFAMIAAFIFAAVAALGPALQITLGTGNYHLLNSLPYIVALVVLVMAWRSGQARMPV